TSCAGTSSFPGTSSTGCPRRVCHPRWTPSSLALDGDLRDVHPGHQGVDARDEVGRDAVDADANLETQQVAVTTGDGLRLHVGLTLGGLRGLLRHSDAVHPDVELLLPGNRVHPDLQRRAVAVSKEVEQVVGTLGTNELQVGHDYLHRLSLNCLW